MCPLHFCHWFAITVDLTFTWASSGFSLLEYCSYIFKIKGAEIYSLYSLLNWLMSNNSLNFTQWWLTSNNSARISYICYMDTCILFINGLSLRCGNLFFKGRVAKARVVDILYRVAKTIVHFATTKMVCRGGYRTRPYFPQLKILFAGAGNLSAPKNPFPGANYSHPPHSYPPWA